MRMRLALHVSAAALAFGLACSRGHQVPTPAKLLPPGSLPAGCGVVTSADMVALGPIADLLRAAVGAGTLDEVLSGGLDVRRDVRRTTTCQFNAGGRSDFVMLLNGSLRPEVFDRLAAAEGAGDARSAGVADSIQGVRVLSRRGLWIAMRPGSGGGELILASRRELLELALVGPSGTYHLEESAGLSAVVSNSEITRRMPQKDRAAGSPLPIREARFSWAPDGSVVLRLLVGNQAAAERLVTDVRPAVGMMMANLSGAGGAPTPPLVEAEEGDVVVRTSLKSDRLLGVVSRIASRSAKPL